MEDMNIIAPEGESNATPDVDEMKVTDTAAEVSKAPKAARPAPNPPIVKLGSFIDDDNDLIEVEMPGQNQREEIKKMERAIKTREVCYGTVQGSELSETMGVVIYMKRETLRIMIPAKDFFALSAMKDMENLNEKETNTRYRRKAGRVFGAVVSFIPKAIAYNEDGVPFVVASREEAMRKLQEKYFFAPNASATVGSVAKASIISTGPRYVTVECLGVESVIGTGELSAFNYIENVADEYSIGEGLSVAIERLNVDKENRTVDVSFSHALVERLTAKVETVSENMRRGRYKATIIAVLKDYYVAILHGPKIRALIPIDGGYLGSDTLYVRDTVVVMVTGINKEKNLVIGRCLKASR